MDRALQAPVALLIYLIALCQVVATAGCQDEIRGNGSQHASTLSGILATQDLGEVVFGLYRSSLLEEPASSSRDAQVAELDRHKTAFVKAVNDIANARTLTNAGQTTDALFTLVDDDTLPALAEHLAGTLEKLQRDPKALDALLLLIQQQPKQTSIPIEEVVKLVGRTLNYPELEALWKGIAKLIDENDGVDAQGKPNNEPKLVQDLLAFARDALQKSATVAPSSRLSQAVTDLTKSLTEEASIRGTFDFGPPEWVVRLDHRGHPRVATDPATGRLYSPFVDANGDGLADVDNQDRFVNASGGPIDRPTFGKTGPGFDRFGRAVAGSGQPLYVYVDAKRTILAIYMQLGGELLRRDAHGKARRIVEVGLGPIGANGTYAADNPVFDLLWGLIELLEPEVAPRMLRAAAQLISQDPALAERVMVTVARGLQASGQVAQQSSLASTSLSDPKIQNMVSDLLPLADDLFEQPATGQVSTARQLLDVLAATRTTAPNFPAQFAPLFKYVTVVRETQPDNDRNSIDESRSVAVDRSQPAGLTNRSVVQQLLDLLARANGCSVLGQNLAVMILNLTADQTPSTVGTLVSLLNGLPGFLQNLFCSGISNDLQSLDALAKSGALDALIPIAKAFKDRGQMPLLVNLLVRLQRDYGTVMRPLEADTALFLESGALESFIEVIDLSRTIRDPISNQSVADIIADALAQLVDDDGNVVDPRGARVSTRFHLLFNPLVELDRRLQAANMGQTLKDLTDGLSAVFLDRVQVNGQEKLKNGSLIPLTAKALDVFSKALPSDAAARAQEVQSAQQSVRSFGGSKDLATIVALLRTIDQSPSRGLINRALIDLLTPKRTSPDDAFGAGARIMVGLLQKPPNLGALQDLAPFLAQVVDPNNPLVPAALRAFQRLLTADQGRTVLNVLRAAFNPGTGQAEAPVLILIRIFQKVQTAGGPAATYDRAKLQGDLAGMVSFIRDRQSGLAWFFQLIKDRQVR